MWLGFSLMSNPETSNIKGYVLFFAIIAMPTDL